MDYYSHVLRDGDPSGDYVLLAVHDCNEVPERLKPVDVVRPPVEDPWFVAYAGTLGLLPDVPDAAAVSGSGFVEGLKYDDIIRTRFQDVGELSPEDLLRRLRNTDVFNPATLSCFGLGVRHAPRDMGLVETDPILPARLAANVGPNVVVLYEPGSVEDLCLLWNLRAAHGLPRGYPLAVPTSADIAAALRAWREGSALTTWQFRKPHLVMVSASVPLDRLMAIAESQPDVERAVSPSEILQPSSMAGRESSDIATFTDGRAKLPAWGSADREALQKRPRPFGSHGLVSRIRPRSRRLPRSQWLERRSGALPGPMGGAWQTNASDPDDIADVSWPSGWTVLTALAHDRQLVVKPSLPGRAAAALLRRLGSLEALMPLLDTQLVARLHRLCEREGMSWFRKEMRRLAKEVHASKRASVVLSHKIDDLLIPRGEAEDGQLLTYDELRNGVLPNRDVTEKWLVWAEKAGLLVKGIRVNCRSCGTTSWRALGEMSQTPVCRGCGDPIARPYPSQHLVFYYRASELLTQVTRWDAFVHLLAMRFFCGLLGSAGDRPSWLYGAYPGVDFFDEATGRHLGEADVVLVSSSGDLVIGECKRSSRGLNGAELRRLDELADRARATWSFVATLAPASDCPSIWPSADRRLPDRPRFVLTAEHLFQEHVTWLMGADPFAWPDQDEKVPDAGVSTRVLDWLENGGGFDAWITSD